MPPAPPTYQPPPAPPTYQPPPQYQPPPYQPEPPTTQYTAPPPPAWIPPGPSPYGVVPQENTSLNGFAVASLILGICGGVLLSAIFGIVALVQIKRIGGRGRGMAIAGIVLSGVWLLAIVVGLAIAIALAPTTSDRDPVSGQVTESGLVSLADLKPGDCITEVAEDEMAFTLPVVPCTEPHRTEVTSIETISGDTYPGDDVVDETAGDLCTDAAQRYAPTVMDAGELDVFYFPPNRAGWNQGDRTVICLVDDPVNQRTSSVAE
jgi:hypothetical protein